MIREVSKYKNNLIASKKKHIYSRLLDYFSMFVVTYLLFTAFYGIGSYTPAVVNISNELASINYQVSEYIDSTHLQRLNEDHSELLSIDDGASKYVKSLCKTSAYVHDLTFPVKNAEGTFDEVAVQIEDTFAYKANEYSLDALSYYFKLFKKNETSLNNYVYDDVDYKDDIDTYLYVKIMGLDATKYVASDDPELIARGNGISKYVVLTEENTISLLRYYREDRADTSIYDMVFLSFISATKYGINEVEIKSTTYLNYIDSFNRVYESLSVAILIIYLISYAFSYLLMTVIMCLISKQWISLGQKVLGLALCSTSELEPTPWQLIGYHLLNFVLFSSSLAIAFFFTGMIGIFSIHIIGSFSLFALLLAIIPFNFISLFFPLFNKNHHDFATFISRLLLKDTKEFEGPIVEDIPEETVEEKPEEAADGREEATN